MGDGTPTRISSVGNSVLPTQHKLLHLSNVLCIPTMWKNLLSVSQFATNNNVFFEFHLTYCVVKDIKTREILLKGLICDGLYYFSPPIAPTLSIVDPSTANIGLQTRTDSYDVFTLWYKCLGHPSAFVVKSVLDKCNITFNKVCLDNVCTACQKGKSHKLPFSTSTTEYNDPFALVVSDLWGPASVACGRNCTERQEKGEFKLEEELHFDLPIINKYTDGLQDEYKIPDNCWTKGLMVQTEDGHWMFKDSLSQILQ
ncbi:hypothetical protein Goarm_002822, partial [Gossypium armourianum]|nr:hypothetical protein [Gossypium armourianum]